jgi:imidazole glycerol-phosphate synthase subunit HisH
MIVVIDYDMGNVGSILNMVKRIGAEAIISTDKAVVRRADKLILPGVGVFDHGMHNLRESGLAPVLSERVLEYRVPVLGICLGMQLLTKGSEEGNLAGLGWIDAETVRFKFDGPANGYKIPHMGWNTVSIRKPGSLLTALHDEPRFYFVHSYHVRCHQETDILATTCYGYEFPSAIARDNIFGTQFHPEKSHRFGMRVLKDFADM